MIRDYISGMQMAYFPPFKLLFLLAAFLLVVESGANLSGVNYLEQQSEQTAKKDDSIAEAHKESVKDKQRAKNFEEAGKYVSFKYDEFEKKYPNICSLVWLLAIQSSFTFSYGKVPIYPTCAFRNLSLLWCTPML